MRFILQEASELQPFKFSTPWPSLIIIKQDLKSDHDHFAITQNSEYWQHYTRSLTGSPFDSSDSEPDSDCDDDDAHSVASLNISSTIDETPCSQDASFVDSEDIESLEITESNALGLMSTSAEDVLRVTQAEGLQAPYYNHGDRSCDRPDQKPQEIGSQGNVSDPPGSTTFKSMDWPGDCKLSRICTISLPKVEEEVEEEGKDLLYSGSGLGGWLTGALDGIPKIALLDCLDIGLPVPFALVVN